MPHGQIVKVVAHKCGAGNADAKLCLQLLKSGWFVFDAHQAVLDAQLLCAHLCGATATSAQEGQLETGLLKEADAQAIAHIETFLKLAIGVEPQPSIREDSIHVQNQ